MSRYIDADALSEVFTKFVRRANNHDFEPTPTWNDAISIFHSMPTVDVVEVGRCGECKFTDGTGAIEDGRHWCVLHESFMYYCSDFEREVNDEQIH